VHRLLAEQDQYGGADVAALRPTPRAAAVVLAAAATTVFVLVRALRRAFPTAPVIGEVGVEVAVVLVVVLVHVTPRESEHWLCSMRSRYIAMHSLTRVFAEEGGIR
jgi:hypothetical protein